MSSDKLNQCVYNKNFLFKGPCPITSCKSHNNKTQRKCLELDRTPDCNGKAITDAELHYFKFDKGITTRMVSLKRKEAMASVKAILTLYKYIEFIKQEYKPKDGNNPKHRRLVRLVNNYPLTVPEIGFETWMLPFLFKAKVYKRFLVKHTGTCSEISLRELLGLTQKKFNKLLGVVKAEFKESRSKPKLTKVAESKAETQTVVEGKTETTDITGLSEQPLKQKEEQQQHRHKQKRKRKQEASYQPHKEDPTAPKAKKGNLSHQLSPAIKAKKKPEKRHVLNQNRNHFEKSPSSARSRRGEGLVHLGMGG